MYEEPGGCITPGSFSRQRKKVPKVKVESSKGFVDFVDELPWMTS
jgi:hypothetical protein